MEKRKEKAKESIQAVLPILFIVLLLSFTVAPVSASILLEFMIGAAFVIIGMLFFSMGAEMSMSPMGERVGGSMLKTKKLWVILLLGFFLGVIITISEPDLQVLAAQVPSVPNMVLILSVAAYAIQSGIESRARVYESLFWVLFVPLFLLLWIAASDVNTIYLHSFFTTPVSEVVEGGLLVFEYLMLVFLVLFFPAYVRKDAQKKMVAAVYRALWVAVLVFIVFDLILLGSFGERAMAKMRYPALTLMSNIHLRGSFLKRLDAFLLAIWFFTLFALINVFLFYAKQLIAAIGGEFTGHGNAERQGDGLKIQKEKKAKVWSTIIAFLLVFVVAEGFCYGSFAEWFESYMTYVAMPLLILLPLIIVVWGKYRKTGNRSLQ